MNLKIAFFLSLVFFYLKMRYGIFVHPFIPFLVLLIKKPLISILWQGFFCGLIVDLFSSNVFGTYCVHYTLTAFFLTFFQKYLDEKKLQTFFLMNLFGCLIFSLITLFTNNLLEKEFSISFSALLTEIVFYCPLDAILGSIFIYYPLYLFERLKKVPFKRLLSRKRKRYAKAQK